MGTPAMERSEHLEPDLFGPQLFWKGEGGANGFYKCSSLQFSPLSPCSITSCLTPL